MFLLKDCGSSCETSNCNTGISEAASKFQTGNQKENCFVCQYMEKDNGDLVGNKYCADQPDLLENASFECPSYADAGCYTGTNAHYSADGVVHEDVYKGKV